MYLVAKTIRSCWSNCPSILKYIATDHSRKLKQISQVLSSCFGTYVPFYKAKMINLSDYFFL
jgi:hypothetical protein